MGGSFGIDDDQVKQKLFKVPMYAKQFETNRPIHRSKFGKSPDLESIKSSIKCSTATYGGKSLASEMTNPVFSRTKQGHDVYKKHTNNTKFCVDYTKAARDATPESLSKLSSIHSQQKNAAKKSSE